MISRRPFLKSLAAFAAAPALVRAQSVKNVIVIGAGAAGLSAAYHLKKAGVNVTVLEANNRMGGRMKRLSGFSNVPLDLGAEWIHTDPTVLGRILGRGDDDMGVKTIAYSPQTYQTWHNGKLKSFNALRFAYEEVKFFNTTWYGFFERFVIPTVADSVSLNAAVSRIDIDGPGVTVRLKNGKTIAGDRVLVTVPISVLQRGGIEINPGIPAGAMRQLRQVTFGSGFKVFAKFNERFYPDLLLEGSRMDAMRDTWASKIYYDAAFEKPTQDNLLGLFTVSDGPLPRAGLADDVLVRSILDELTKIFGDVVARSFVGARVQNWSREAHIQGSYSMNDESSSATAAMLPTIDGRIFFAGEFLGGNSRSTVHGAAFSGSKAVSRMLKS